MHPAADADGAPRHPAAGRRHAARVAAARPGGPAPVRGQLVLERAAAGRRADRSELERVRERAAQPGRRVRHLDQHRSLQRAGLHGAGRRADGARRPRQLRPAAPAGLRAGPDPRGCAARRGQRRADGRVAARDGHDVGVLARVQAARHVARRLGRADDERLRQRRLLQRPGELGRDRHQPAAARRPDADRRAPVGHDRPRARDRGAGDDRGRLLLAGAAQRRHLPQQPRAARGHPLPDRSGVRPLDRADVAARADHGRRRAALRDRHPRHRRQRRVLRGGPDADRLGSLRRPGRDLRGRLARAGARAVPVGPPRGAADAAQHRRLYERINGARARWSSATAARRS